MSSLDQQARGSLTKLVEHVFAHRNGLISALTYEDLAFRIGRLNKHNAGHGHGMGNVLGRMGHLLQGLEGQWGEPIPHIQSLVVQKTGADKGLPDEGIKEFWPDYPKMSRVEKRNRTRIEHQHVLMFGSRWNDVLEKLGLSKVVDPSAPGPSARPYGCGGESNEHKAMKAFVRDHPWIVGATNQWQSFIEYPLPTLDEIDVLFKTDEECIAVEVKSAISDTCLFDYERGLYQTIKYGALLRAMSLSGQYDIPKNVQSVLVLESELPTALQHAARLLGVQVIENVSPASYESHVLIPGLEPERMWQAARELDVGKGRPLEEVMAELRQRRVAEGAR